MKQKLGKAGKKWKNKLQAHMEPGVDAASSGCDIHCYCTSDVCWDKYWAGLFISETKETKEEKSKSNSNTIPSYAGPQDNTAFLHFIAV